VYINDIQSNLSIKRRVIRLYWCSLVIKRIVDVVFSSIGLLFLSPWFALIAVAIKRDTPGPVFYHGRRVGQGGREFLILKFRTMYETQESYSGPKVTAGNDPRITPLGNWLRNTKLNELPQLWNVLKGDMSLVGPRPEDPEIASQWPPEVREKILSVRPGMTSPASVQYHNEEDLLTCDNLFHTYINHIGPDKIRLDLMYVRHRTLWLDLDAILWTFLLLLPNIRAHVPPEELLFVGPITRLMRRYINWFVLDLFVTFASISFVTILWRLVTPLNVGWIKAIGVVFGFSFIFSLIGALLGVNKIAWTKARMEDSFDLLPAWIASTLIAFTLNQVTQIFPAALVIIAFMLAGIGFVTARYRTRLIRSLLVNLQSDQPRSGNFQERVLIVGSGPSAQHVAWMFTHPLNAVKFKIIGFIDNDLFIQGMRIYGAKVIGKTNDIKELLQLYAVDIVLMTETKTQEYQAVLEACKTSLVRLITIPDILNTLSCISSTSLQVPITGSNGEEEPDSPCSHCLIHTSSDISVNQN
jgi:lipopolysaccharide/colanic/teichoic acid biosynthesis glycosyltransferase